MNLFRNQNKKFEKKLKQQLRDMEYKASDSLWDKIATEIPEDNFENTFAENVNSFESKPNSEIWNKIENQLPGTQQKNYRFLWIPLLFVFFGSAAYFGYQFKNKQLANDNGQLAISEKKLENHKLKDEKTGNKQLANNNKQEVISNDQLANNKKQLAISNKQLEVRKGKLENRSSLDKVDEIGNEQLANSDKKFEVRKGKLENKNKQEELKKVDRSSTFKNEIISDLLVKSDPSVENTNTIQAQQNQDAKAIMFEQKNEVLSNNIIPKVDSTIISNIPPVADANKNSMDSLSNKMLVQNSTSDEKLTKFSISVISGMQNCYNHLSAPSNSSINFSENLALRKSIETPMLDWNGAFLLDYSINSNWRISSGVMVSNFSQQFQYAIQNPIGDHASIKDPSAKMNNQNDSIVNGNSYSNHIKYTWTEIPLFISYSFSQKRKIGIEITSGVSYAIISGVDASYVSNDNVGVLILTDKNGFPGVKNNFFFHFYPTVTYKLNELVQIGIAPTFKYSINSITDNSNWIQQQPYFLGLSAMLRKKF